MAKTAINLASGQKADRKLEMVFVNVGNTETPEWEIQGRGVEDASWEYNHDVEQTHDILGMTDTDVSDATPSMELDPMIVRGGQKLAAKLLDIERRQAKSELSLFDVLVVHCYLGEEGAFQAEVDHNCSIVPQSLGGDNYVGLPINIYLSGERDLGTATIAAGKPTFTDDSEA